MSFSLERGRAPLLVSIPHAGTYIPDELRPAYLPRALAVEDTDWHLAGSTRSRRTSAPACCAPSCQRYVIDLNRPPDDTPMYPGAEQHRALSHALFHGRSALRAGTRARCPKCSAASSSTGSRTTTR
jgi:N-formylglutamate deformylase